MTGIDDNQYPVFPGKTVMKVITDSAEEEDIRRRLDGVFDELELPEREWNCKYSGKKRYVSFSTSVRVESREQLHRLYEKLKKLPEVRYIL